MTKTQKIRQQFGLWSSPITPISLARGTSFSDVVWSEEGILVWREQRSDRGVLVIRLPGEAAPRDLNHTHSVRARVGYGGGDFTVGGSDVFFVDADSNRIYCQTARHGLPQPVTPAFGSAASPTLSPDGRWLLFVHTYEDRDVLAIVDREGKLWPNKLVSGQDFYMQPCWSPGSDKVAWIAWNHPNMPWDGTSLYIGTLDHGRQGLPTLKDVRILAGSEDVSVYQPLFSPDGRYLIYSSDETGWWQLYLVDLESDERRQLTQEPAEHAQPAWVQGLRSYAFSPDGSRIYFIRNKEGFASLWEVELASGKQQQIPLDQEYTWLEQLSVSPQGETLAVLASGCTTSQRVLIVHRSGKKEIIARSSSENLPPDMYSACEAVQWAGMDGDVVYGLFYPPQNQDYEGNGQPPLIISIHGGPTSQSRASFNPRAQFFTSRGYAYLEVNYRGSTGYGRDYRNMLREMWGVYDVQDAVSGGQQLAEQGRVDGSKVVIIGGSAGGFTVLKAMEDFPGFFKAGICLYGVSNQFTLVADTHKFEAHYSDSLLGPLPEAADIYRERSPIFFVDKIQDPILIFQGEEDQVVPRSQSDAVVESLRRRGVPHEYHLYPGEGHGFRKTETIEHYYQTIEKFLKQYVVFA